MKYVGFVVGVAVVSALTSFIVHKAFPTAPGATSPGLAATIYGS